jgi:hypothetical protein
VTGQGPVLWREGRCAGFDLADVRRHRNVNGYAAEGVNKFETARARQQGLWFSDGQTPANFLPGTSFWV